ncbi:MAG: hypothetical protein AB1422_18500 [bacterium]
MKKNILVLLCIVGLVVGVGKSSLASNDDDSYVIKQWDFKDEDSVSEWKTDGIWASNYKGCSKGKVSWSEEYEGSAKLSVSGAPGSINFWQKLPCDLKEYDCMEVEYAVKKPTHPIATWSMQIGPAKPHGHAQYIGVAPTKAGRYIVQMPVYQIPFVKGTPFGIGFSVWPGKSDIYVISIKLIRNGAAGEIVEIEE